MFKLMKLAVKPDFKEIATSIASYQKLKYFTLKGNIYHAYPFTCRMPITLCILSGTSINSSPLLHDDNPRSEYDEVLNVRTKSNQFFTLMRKGDEVFAAYESNFIDLSLYQDIFKDAKNIHQAPVQYGNNKYNSDVTRKLEHYICTKFSENLIETGEYQDTAVKDILKEDYHDWVGRSAVSDHVVNRLCSTRIFLNKGNLSDFHSEKYGAFIGANLSLQFNVNSHTYIFPRPNNAKFETLDGKLAIPYSNCTVLVDLEQPVDKPFTIVKP